jgi:DNA-binding response OmpR family regulator
MKKILLVDDQADIRQLMRLLLEHEFELFEASSGDDVIPLIEAHCPDAVVLDVMMPGNLDGFDVLRQIRSRNEWQSIYIVMVSARGQSEDVDSAISIGANSYFVKPFSPIALVNHLRQNLL